MAQGQTIQELINRANSGDINAMIELGKRYRDGNGVPKDYK